MSPPFFSDLGKQARDIITKGYHFNLFKIDAKTRKENGAELSSCCTFNHQKCNLLGSIEVKQKIKEYGLALLGKWNTQNVFTFEGINQDQITPGLKISADASLSFQETLKSCHVKAAYVHDVCALNGEIDFGDKSSDPSIAAAAVVGYQGFLLGGQTKFAVHSSEITGNAVSIGYVHSDFVLHAKMVIGKDTDCSLFGKLTPEVEGCLCIKKKDSDLDYELGVKYALDNSVSIRAKLDSKYQMGLGYRHKLMDGVTVTLSTSVDVGNGNGGSRHKLGIAVELEA